MARRCGLREGTSSREVEPSCGKVAALSQEPVASRWVASPVRVEEQNDLAIRVLGESQPTTADAAAVGDVAEDIRTLYVE